MTRKVLIIASEKSPYLLNLEKRIFTMGFETLLTIGMPSAVERLESEIFSFIVFDMACTRYEKRDFFRLLSSIPMAAVTPLVILREGTEQLNLPQMSSVLDQTFSKDTSVNFIGDYLRETDEIRKKKVKKGSLAGVSVPRIISDAGLFRLTGAVICERGEEKKIIYFDNGDIIFASSNRPEERFGEYIVSQGLISKEQLLQALTISRKSTLKFGEILVEMGFIRQDTLVPLLQSQIKHIVFSIFDWDSGDFYVLPEETSSVKDMPHRFRVPSMLFEGIKRRFSSSQLSALLRPLDRTITFDKGARPKPAEFGISALEAAFAERIKDGSTIESVLRLGPMTELESLRIIFLLWVTKGIRFSEIESMTAFVFPSLAKKKESPVIAEVEMQSSAVKSGEIDRKKEAMSFNYKTNAVEELAKKKGWSLFWKLILGLGSAMFAVIIAIYIYIEYGAFEKKAGDEEVARVKVGRLELEVKRDSMKKGMAETSARKGDTPVQAAREEAAPAKEIPAGPGESKPGEARSVQKVVAPLKRAGASDGSAKAFLDLLASAGKHYEDGELEASLADYEKAYRLRKNSDKVLVGMGQVLFDLNRSVEAIEKYKEAARVNPRNAEAHLNLGAVYQFHGKDDLAVREYEEFLKLDPSSEKALEVKRVLKKLKGE